VFDWLLAFEIFKYHKGSDYNNDIKAGEMFFYKKKTKL